MKFYIVDAFTKKLFGGNPAGVVLLPEGQDFPEDEVMRKTAAELRYSETAFIRRAADREFNIRYFTPAAEVDLCGHATIGSFCALMDAGLVKSGGTYINDTLAGRLEIQAGEGFVMMEMGEAKSLGRIDGEQGLEELYRVMGLEPAVRPEGLFPELVSTGLPDIMMPVSDQGALSAIKPDFPALSALSDRYQVTGVHAFSTAEEWGADGDAGAVHCRNFAPLYEIDEEAATGTANGALTYYLYSHELISAGAENRFVQGETMDRPSLVLSRLTVDGDQVKIMVGGSAVVLARGEIML